MHTPEPWRVYTNSTFDEGRHILAGPIAGEEARIICEQIDSEAHARLIAAAPELLSALERLLDAAIVGSLPNDWDNIAAKARAAILAAKGAA